ncbi:MAG: Gldg family protein [Myxococcota bacterium]|nr:Gldg family protein [Myxococcota bacterium]
MRGLGTVGLVALAFAAGSYYTSDQFGAFGYANLVLSGLALAGGAVSTLRRAEGLGTPEIRRLLAPRIALVALAFAGAVGLERCADRHGFQLDWTAEDRYSLSDATRTALAALPGPVDATLYHDTYDTRTRSTRLLLKTLARAGDVTVHQRVLDEAPDEAERYDVTRSNTVVLAVDGRFETVERPTEGSLFEALQRLHQDGDRVVYVARGEGEGSLGEWGQTGYTGLGAALETEGFMLREIVTAAATEIPEDADVLLFVAPRRGLREPFLAALERYLEGGGRMVALLEPGVVSGLEELLGRWGFGLPDAVVVDPASGPVEGDPPGVNPIVFAYASHPVTRGLDSTRMTFFLRARPVLAERKPQPDDEMRALAFASRRAWLAPNVEAVQRGLVPVRPQDAREDYWPVAAAGRFPREAGEARIVVFGDADFAANRYLRALYNLDILVNALHWTTEREAAITLRPKALTPDQFPLTPQQSLQMFYGVGMLVPEICLIVAALIWIRRRSG